MTVKELKNIIKDIPDDAEIYIADEDIGEETKATDIYFALEGTKFHYKSSVNDCSAVKAIEICGFLF